MGDDVAAGGNQRGQQAVLGPGQDEFLVRDGGGVAAAVEHDGAPSQLTGATRLRLVATAPHHGSDARQQLLLAERFDHVVVRAGVQCFHLGALVGLAGENDDRRLRHAPDRAADFHAVETGHGEVQQHQVRALLGEAAQSCVAVVRGHDTMTGPTDQGRNGADHRRLVVNDEDQQARLRHRTHGAQVVASAPVCARALRYFRYPSEPASDMTPASGPPPSTEVWRISGTATMKRLPLYPFDSNHTRPPIAFMSRRAA